MFNEVLTKVFYLLCICTVHYVYELSLMLYINYQHYLCLKAKYRVDMIRM